MENFTTQYDWLLTAIAALGGWKLVNWILNRKEIKRKALAEAISLETDSLVKRYNVMEQELEKLKQKVEELQVTVATLQQDKLDLMKRNAELEIALREAEHNVCVRPDDECLKRMPPRTYCRLKRLSQGYYDEYYNTDKTKKKKGDEDVKISEKPN